MDTNEMNLPFDFESINVSYFIKLSAFYANDLAGKLLQQSEMKITEFRQAMESHLGGIINLLPLSFAHRMTYDESLWSVESMHYGQIIRIGLYRGQSSWIFDLTLSKPLAIQGCFIGNEKNHTFNPGAVVNDSRLKGNQIIFVPYMEDN